MYGYMRSRPVYFTRYSADTDMSLVEEADAFVRAMLRIQDYRPARQSLPKQPRSGIFPVADLIS